MTTTPSTGAGESTTTGSLPQIPTTTPGDPNLVPNRIPFNVGEIAAAGPDCVSVGALTHSAPALDLSMILE